MADPVPGAKQDLALAIEAQIPRHVPGLSVALIDAGGLRWAQGFGLASIAGQRPVTNDTAFLWFSMTKIATATAAMLLVQRGALGLADPAAKYLPELAANYSPAGGTPISVRHLLSHQSGLPNPLPLAWVTLEPHADPDPGAFAMRLLLRYPRPRWTPGSRAEYGNLNFLALGEIISRAAGQPFADFVRTELLGPLGMSRTDFGYSPANSDDAAVGYQPRSNPLNPLLRLLLPAGLLGGSEGRFLALNRFSVSGSAYGGLIGPAADAARLLQLHLAAGRLPDGRQLLAPDLVRSMQQIQGRSREMEIGLGWFRWRRDSAKGPAYLGHQGSGAGFFNQMRFYPDEGIGIVLMGNSTQYKHDAILAAALRSM